MFYIITIWYYKVPKWFYVERFAPILNSESSISEIVMQIDLNQFNLFSQLPSLAWFLPQVPAGGVGTILL